MCTAAAAAAVGACLEQVVHHVCDTFVVDGVAVVLRAVAPVKGIALGRVATQLHECVLVNSLQQWGGWVGGGGRQGRNGVAAWKLHS